MDQQTENALTCPTSQRYCHTMTKTFFTKSPVVFASSGLIVVAILAAGTIVQASTGAPTVAPRATTTHTATFTSTPSSAWDLDNCVYGQIEYDGDGFPIEVVDEDGNPVYEFCFFYGVKDDDYSANMRAGSFTVRTTLSRLPAGWGLCSSENPAYQGWLWTMSGGHNGGFGEGILVYSQRSTSPYFLPETEMSWSDGGNVVTRTFTVTTPNSTSTRDVPVLNSTNVALCGPDPSTRSGQGWRNYVIPEYRLPEISRWR